MAFKDLSDLPAHVPEPGRPPSKPRIMPLVMIEWNARDAGDRGREVVEKIENGWCGPSPVHFCSAGTHKSRPQWRHLRGVNGLLSGNPYISPTVPKLCPHLGHKIYRSAMSTIRTQTTMSELTQTFV